MTSKIDTASAAQSHHETEQQLRRSRASVARWVGLFTIGCVLLGAIYVDKDDALMPGPLSASHSLQKDCHTCHKMINEGRIGWLHAIFARADTTADSKACMSCHKISKDPFKPHNLTGTALETRTQRSQSVQVTRGPSTNVRLSTLVLPSTIKNADSIYCATCHREHKDSDFELKHVSDGQCQSCHLIQFKSFSKGHPEFSSYPYKRRTRINFDHASHFNKHFPDTLKKKTSSDNDVPSVCTDCHVTAQKKKLMTVRPFKRVCSSCHVAQIIGTERATGPKGIPFLSVPGLDLETLKENGVNIGSWPQRSEAEVTPFVMMLLSLDPKRKYMMRKISDLDLLDLSEATAEELAAVEQFAWEFKSLFHQLTSTEMRVLSDRIRKATGARVDIDLATNLVAALPRDVLASAQRRWLPNLDAEIKSRPHDENALWETTVKQQRTQQNSDEPDRATSVRKTDDDGAPEPNPETIKANTFHPDLRSNLVPTGQSKILRDHVNNRRRKDIQLAQSAPQHGWHVNPKGELVKDGSEQHGDATEESDEPQQSSDDTRKETPETSKPHDTTEADATTDVVDSEAWASLGGWYRKDFTIYYKPTGHADPFLHAWMDFSGKLLDGTNTNTAAPIFSGLTHKDAQGQCVKCHSIDLGEDGTRSIQWGTSRLADKTVRLTTFFHEPHFGLLDERGCLTCHKINDAAKYQETYTQFNPTLFSSNFMPMTKSQCDTCHNRKAARQDCLICHNYHANAIVSPIARTKVPGSALTTSDPKSPATNTSPATPPQVTN